MNRLAILISFALSHALLGQAIETSRNPALGQKRYQADLNDAFTRLDPTKDGWESEARADDYAAALAIFFLKLPSENPHPVIFNEANSTSAIRWANHSCRS